MRSLLPVLLAVACAGGCRGILGGKKAEPTGPLPEQSVSSMVGYLNTQASHLRSVGYTDVSLTVHDPSYPVPIRLGDSTLYVAQPRNLRLIGGGVVIGTQLDLGSNDREFWMYVKQLPGDNYFYCSHADFASGKVRFPVPFDTDWVLQAVGMATYPTDESRYQLKTEGREYVLTERTATRSGQAIFKQTAFSPDTDNGRKPVVRRHVVRDERNAVLATAEIKAVKKVDLGTDPVTNKPALVQIPTEVALEWPQQKFRMELTLGRPAVNENLDDRFAALFGKPDIKGTNPIDLARYEFRTTSFRGQAPGDPRRDYWWPRVKR